MSLRFCTSSGSVMVKLSLCLCEAAPKQLGVLRKLNPSEILPEWKRFKLSIGRSENAQRKKKLFLLNKRTYKNRKKTSMNKLTTHLYKAVIRMLASGHRLRIEIGRWHQTAKEDCTCPHCNVAGDEIRALVHYILYGDTRGEMLRKIETTGIKIRNLEEDIPDILNSNLAEKRGQPNLTNDSCQLVLNRPWDITRSTQWRYDFSSNLALGLSPCRRKKRRPKTSFFSCLPPILDVEQHSWSYSINTAIRTCFNFVFSGAFELSLLVWAVRAVAEDQSLGARIPGQWPPSLVGTPTMLGGLDRRWWLSRSGHFKLYF